MVGLFAFFYGTLHFLTYIDRRSLAGLRLSRRHRLVDDRAQRSSRRSASDIYKRPYITVGFTALVLMVPLASRRRPADSAAGRKKWQALHRLVYVSAIAGVRALLVAGEGGHQPSADRTQRSSLCCSARACTTVTRRRGQRPPVVSACSRTGPPKGGRDRRRFTFRRSASPSASTLDRQSARG